MVWDHINSTTTYVMLDKERVSNGSCTPKSISSQYFQVYEFHPCNAYLTMP